MVLTPLVLKALPRGVGNKALTKSLEKNDTVAAWNKSSWAKKLEQRKVRAGLSDFDRFKLLKLKSQVKNWIGKRREQRYLFVFIFSAVSPLVLLSRLPRSLLKHNTQQSFFLSF
jgi:hypothetical protein